LISRLDFQNVCSLNPARAAEDFITVRILKNSFFQVAPANKFLGMKSAAADRNNEDEGNPAKRGMGGPFSATG
jgi:hypothetical protein